MRKSIFIFRKPYLGLAAVVIITVLVIVAACMPTGLPTTGGGVPYIQSITAQVMPAGSATPGATTTPGATATAAATGSPTASATLGATSTPTASAAATVTPSASATAASTMSPTATAAATGTPSATATTGATTIPTATAAATGGSSIMITVQPANFQVVNNLGGAAVPGQGHIHYFMDTIPPIATGVVATTAPGTVVEIPQTTYTWPNVQPGLHVFSVELINNDHTPLAVPAVASVLVMVPAAGTTAAQQITSITATIMAGVTATPGATASGAATGTPTASATLGATSTPTSSAAATGTPSASATAASTMTPSATDITGGTTTPGATATGAATMTPGATATATATSSPNATATAAATGGSSIMITVQTSGATPAASGQSMFNYYLDAVPPTFPNMTATTMAGTSVSMAATSYTWPNVMPGVHILSVEMVSNGMPMNPPVVASVLITIPQAVSGTSTPAATASAAATGIPTTSATPGATTSATPGATATAAATGMPTTTSSTGGY